MQIRGELVLMNERMFDEALLNRILDAYKQEMQDDEADITEREFETGKKSLLAVLNDNQKLALTEMESLCAENVKYALKFGFIRGIFVGFQQYFERDTTKCPFEKFVADEILKQPHMNKYVEYSNRRIKFNEICKVMEEQLDEVDIEHVISVYCGWEDRLYGVLRYAFYMGYRYALYIIEEVEPIGATLNMIEKIQLTEYEIGFTTAVDDRERRRGGKGHPEVRRPQAKQ